MILAVVSIIGIFFLLIAVMVVMNISVRFTRYPTGQGFRFLLDENLMHELSPSLDLMVPGGAE